MQKLIMVMNDTQEILELFHDILTGEGYRVSLHSYNTRELDEVKRVGPDLIISDHPPFQEQQGWQFIQKLKMEQKTAHIPIIICTTNTRWVRENVDEGILAAKGISVVLKPFDVPDLLTEIEARLNFAQSQNTPPYVKAETGTNHPNGQEEQQD